MSTHQHFGAILRPYYDHRKNRIRIHALYQDLLADRKTSWCRFLLKWWIWVTNNGCKAKLFHGYYWNIMRFTIMGQIVDLLWMGDLGCLCFDGMKVPTLDSYIYIYTYNVPSGNPAAWQRTIPHSQITFPSKLHLLRTSQLHSYVWLPKGTHVGIAMS